jgi:hypothetical protein
MKLEPLGNNLKLYLHWRSVNAKIQATAKRGEASKTTVAVSAVLEDKTWPM